MKKVLGAVAGVVVLAVGGFAAVVAMQPGTLHVERSREMAAAPEDVWPHVADYQSFVNWNPWKEMEPNAKVEISDPSTGVDAWYTWHGEVTGQGKMTTKSVQPPNLIVQELTFIEPMASVCETRFAIDATAGGSKVTWSFTQELDFMGKAFGLFVDMDAMLGADFDKGLGKLAAVAEADAKARAEREAAAAAAQAAAAAAAAADPNAPAVAGAN